MAKRIFAVVVLGMAIGCSPGGVNTNGNQDPPPQDPLTPEQITLLGQFSDCMNQANWDAAGMGGWALKAAEGGAVCASCHSAGLARFLASENDLRMFEGNRFEVFINGFFSVDGDVVISNRLRLEAKGAGSGLHPTYITNDLLFDAVDEFVRLTNEQLAAGGCGPAGFPVPPPDGDIDNIGLAQ